MTRRTIRMHPSFGLRDHATGEPLTPPAKRDELAARWRALDEYARPDVEEDWFQRVVAELGKRHRLTFQAEIAWPDSREEMVAVGAAAGVALERNGAMFAGRVVPELVATMINSGTFQVEMLADGELIVEVSDDLGLVFLHLNDDELGDIRAALAALRRG